jgi:hypothetical protein
LLTGYCAFCIRAKARCSLVFLDIERREINNKQQATKLRIARAKAELAATELSLLESEAKRRGQELKEITAIEELEQLEDKARLLKDPLPLLEPIKRTANSIILDPRLFANLG